MKQKGKTALLSIIFVLAAALFAQSADWYYNKPIRSIDFEGLKAVKKADLEGIIAPFIGKNFTDDLYSDLLNRIYALEYFDDIEPRIFPNKDGVTLTFTVKEKPMLFSITYAGNKEIRTSEIKEVVTSKEKTVFNAAKLRLDERAIRDLYLKKGFTNIRISTETEEKDGDIRVKFLINEGSATIIKAINFEGNEIVSSKSLRDAMSLKQASLFNKGSFQEASLELDKQAILNYYHNRGYVDVELRDVVRTENNDEKTGKNELVLTFIIREGIQYTYGGTTFEGNKIFSSQKLEDLIKLKTGAVFNMSRFQEGIAAVADLYYENGYTSNYIGTDEEKNPELKRISFKVTIVERPRSHIENIILQGNKKTKDNVILRELPLESGDIFSKTKLIQGLRNLYNLQFFSGVVPDVLPGSEENLVNLIVSVEEQSTTSVEFGVTFSGVTDPDAFPVSVFLKWQDSNVFGTGKVVSTNVTVSPDQQSASVGYTDNWLLGLPISVGTNLQFSHAKYTTLQNVYFPSGVNSTNYYMNYDQWKIGWDIYAGRRWYPMFAIVSLNGGIQFSVIRNDFDPHVFKPYDSAVVNNANIWGFLNSVWSSVSLDNRNVNYDPSKGWFFSQRVSWTGLFPTIESEYFFKSDTKVEGYVTLLDIPFTPKWSFKLILAGYTGLSLILPATDRPVGYDSQLYIDGMFNARGWRYLYNDPRYRGQALWSNYAELRIPIVPNVFAIDWFFDAAAVKPTAADFFTKFSLNDMLFSYGPGLRFLIPQFPLRLLFANTFRVQNGSYVKDSSWQFVLSFNMVNR